MNRFVNAMICCAFAVYIQIVGCSNQPTKEDSLIPFDKLPENTLNEDRKNLTHINIKVTLDQYREKLEKRQKELQIELKKVDENEEYLVETEIKALDDKIKNLNNSYEKYVSLLQQRISYLEKVDLFTAEHLYSIKKALVTGDDDIAEALFASIEDSLLPIEDKTEDQIRQAAEAAFQRGLIAKDNARYRRAIKYFERASELMKDNSQYLWQVADLAIKLDLYDKAQLYGEKALDIKTERSRGRYTEADPQKIKDTLAEIRHGEKVFRSNRFPQASTFTTIPKEYFQRLAKSDKITLGNIGAYLLESLSSAGYSDGSFYSISGIPDGFVLVTRLEQIEKDGTPKSGMERWSLKVDPVSQFSLGAYLKALFTAQPGYFRLIIFVISPDAVLTSDQPLEETQASTLLTFGMPQLPNRFDDEIFTAKHNCTALIYEFEKEKGIKEAKTLIPSSIPGAEHLAKAGIWKQLKK